MRLTKYRYESVFESVSFVIYVQVWLQNLKKNTHTFFFFYCFIAQKKTFGFSIKNLFCGRKKSALNFISQLKNGCVWRQTHKRSTHIFNRSRFCINRIRNFVVLFLLLILSSHNAHFSHWLNHAIATNTNRFFPPIFSARIFFFFPPYF